MWCELVRARERGEAAVRVAILRVDAPAFVAAYRAGVEPLDRHTAALDDRVW